MNAPNTEAKNRRAKTSNILFSRTDKPLTITDAAGNQVPAVGSNGQPLHPAALAWLKSLDQAGRPLSMAECVDALAKRHAAGEFKTKQALTRVVYYWKAYLLQSGFLVQQKVAAAPAAAAAAATA